MSFFESVGYLNGVVAVDLDDIPVPCAVFCGIVLAVDGESWMVLAS